MSNQINPLINSQDNDILGRWQKVGRTGPLGTLESRTLRASPWDLHLTPLSSLRFLLSAAFLLKNEEPAPPRDSTIRMHEHVEPAATGRTLLKLLAKISLSSSLLCHSNAKATRASCHL